MSHRKAITCFLCSKKYFPKSYPFHLKSCILKQPRRSLECPKCKSFYSKIEFAEHYFNCNCGKKSKSIFLCQNQNHNSNYSINHSNRNTVSNSNISENNKTTTFCGHGDNRLPRRKPSKDYTGELDLYQLINETTSNFDNNNELFEIQSKRVDLRTKCSVCNRKFSPDRIGYHESICKDLKGKRKVFDSKAQRNKGIGDTSINIIKSKSNGQYHMTLSKSTLKSSFKNSDTFPSTVKTYTMDSQFDGISGFNFGGPSCLVQNGQEQFIIEQMKSFAMKNTLPRYTSHIRPKLDPWHFNWRKKHQDFQSILRFRISKDSTKEFYKNRHRKTPPYIIPPLSSSILPSSLSNKQNNHLNFRSTLTSDKFESFKHQKYQGHCRPNTNGDETIKNGEPVKNITKTKTMTSANSYSTFYEPYGKSKFRDHRRRPSSSSTASSNRNSYSLHGIHDDNERGLKDRRSYEWRLHELKNRNTSSYYQYASSTIPTEKMSKLKYLPTKMKVRPSTSHLLQTYSYSKVSTQTSTVNIK